MAFNHRPAGWDRRLLIVGGESVAADLKLQGFQNMDRLAFRRKRFAKSPTMRASIPKRDGLLKFGNRRKAEELPFTGLAQKKAGQIIHVNPLHDNYDRAGALVVEAPAQTTSVRRRYGKTAVLRCRRLASNRTGSHQLICCRHDRSGHQSSLLKVA